MTKERIVWADSLKGWLMILVIIGHALQGMLGEECYDNHVWNLIYSFHMPAFMAISGWLSCSSKPFGSDWNSFFGNCKRRALQLLVPYFVWSLIQFALSGNYTIERLLKLVLYPDAFLWFLWVLFWICVLFNLARLVANKCKIDEIIPVGVVCVVLLGLMVGAEIRVFGFQFISYYFLFYTLGYCLHKYESSTLLASLRSVVATIVMTLLWLFLAWGWTMHGLPSWIPSIPHVPSSLIQYAYRGLTALVAIVVLINVAPKALNFKNRVNSIISRVGIISLGMYTGHLVIMGYINKLLLLIFPDIQVGLAVVIISILAFAVSYLLIRLIEKNRIAARVFLGKL